MGRGLVTARELYPKQVMLGGAMGDAEVGAEVELVVQRQAARWYSSLGAAVGVEPGVLEAGTGGW